VPTLYWCPTLFVSTRQGKDKERDLITSITQPLPLVTPLLQSCPGCSQFHLNRRVKDHLHRSSTRLEDWNYLNEAVNTCNCGTLVYPWSFSYKTGSENVNSNPDNYLMFEHWLNLNNRIRNPIVIQERFYLTTKGASCIAIKYKWSRFQFFFYMFLG